MDNSSFIAFDETWTQTFRHIFGLLDKELRLDDKTDPIWECGGSVLQIIEEWPEEVKQLAHRKLHTWPFREVPLSWRRAYEDASLHQVRKLVKTRLDGCIRHEHGKTNDADLDLSTLSSTLDMAIIMTGAPKHGKLIEDIFSHMQSCLTTISSAELDEHATFPSDSNHVPLTSTVPEGAEIDLDQFSRHMHASSGPLVIRDATKHWPAYRLWRNPGYLWRQTLNGRRLVPVELGRSYTDDGWSQRIMSYGEYLEKYLMDPINPEKGYLAQHDLLDQIPALSRDIEYPDLCYADMPPSKTGVATLDLPIRNAWIGPAHTITPLHTDPYHNILCQVVGRKYIQLYSPEETPKLYPRGVDEAGINMDNTSYVDVAAARGSEEAAAAGQDVQYPLFRDAKYLECILEAGQALYIPEGWWHYVESLEVSFNVSYWFN